MKLVIFLVLLALAQVANGAYRKPVGATTSVGTDGTTSATSVHGQVPPQGRGEIRDANPGNYGGIDLTTADQLPSQYAKGSARVHISFCAS